MRRLVFWASIALLGIIVAASLIPGTWRPHTPLRTTIEHLVAYGLVAFWFTLILPRVWQRIGFAALLVGLSALMELAQLFVPGRAGELRDIVYSALGVGIGTFAGAAFLLMSAVVAQGWRRLAARLERARS